MSRDTTLTVSQTATSTRLTALLAALLGAALIFVAGFLETEVVHNAAHDTRHAAVFPCH